jgi:hypothetical protein
MSRHTFIGITTAIVEKWGVEYGCEHHRYLVSQCHQLYEELQVRNSFVFLEYLYIVSSSNDFLIHSLPLSGLPDKVLIQQFSVETPLFYSFSFKKTVKVRFTIF